MDLFESFKIPVLIVPTQPWSESVLFLALIIGKLPEFCTNSEKGDCFLRFERETTFLKTVTVALRGVFRTEGAYNHLAGV